ncbi:metallophosphoesterase [Thalassovita mangrovi]|uniref:Calcineurin-like phosphoesterase domain-containing protein n=1 Tax=Thalassovita mangrovi TaxID=2692236 RepID=A0A6L8LV29_9RHOB|nr:metallophosphoesterase [Thalassovita mangrovi]MYM56979.1 hypothetical protein [Thalassovita mangrovi]
MPALVIADLHLDLWLKAGRDPFQACPPETLRSLDALFIAGDLCNKPKARWSKMLEHISRYVPLERVYVTPGNHDYYGHTFDKDDSLERIAKEAGAHFVQTRQVHIEDTRFLCCTLWTDFQLFGDVSGGMQDAQEKLNDYRSIRVAAAGYRRLQPIETRRKHLEHRQWLENKLTDHFPGRTVVVTHHAPLPTAAEAIHQSLQPAYCSDLTSTIERSGVDEWLFGHTHIPVEVEIGAARVRNVSLGYPDQVAEGQEVHRLLSGWIDT